jgi:hypothetical protein
MTESQRHDWHNRAAFAWVILCGVAAAWVFTLASAVAFSGRVVSLEVELRTVREFDEKQRLEDNRRWARIEDKLDDLLKKAG